MNTLPLVIAALLSGCTPGEPGVRIALLVLLPVAFVALLLWAVRRGRRKDGDPRLRGPDYDDRR